MIEVNSGQRIEDHFVEITEMVEIRAVPESLPPAENMKKLESKRRKKPKALKSPPSETDVTGGSKELGGM